MRGVRSGQFKRCRSPTRPTRSPVFTSQLTPRSTCWFLNVMLTSSSFTPLLTVLAPAPGPSAPPAAPPRPRLPLPLPLEGLPLRRGAVGAVRLAAVLMLAAAAAAGGV